MGGRGGSLRSRMHSAKLPALSGSEKQNEWANSVRNLYVEAYNWEKNHDDHDEAYKNRGPILIERANLLAKKGILTPAEINAGSGGEASWPNWAKSLKVESMEAFDWTDHDDLTNAIKNSWRNSLTYVEHPKGESQEHKAMMDAREKAINKFYGTVQKEMANKMTILDDDAFDKMPSKQFDAAYKANINNYYRFLRKYGQKTLATRSKSSWWIDNMKL